MTKHNREVFFKKKMIVLATHYHYAQVYICAVFPPSGHFDDCNRPSQQNPMEFSTPGQELRVLALGSGRTKE